MGGWVGGWGGTIHNIAASVHPSIQPTHPTQPELNHTIIRTSSPKNRYGPVQFNNKRVCAVAASRAAGSWLSATRRAEGDTRPLASKACTKASSLALFRPAIPQAKDGGEEDKAVLAMYSHTYLLWGWGWVGGRVEGSFSFFSICAGWLIRSFISLSPTYVSTYLPAYSHAGGDLG